MRFRLSLFVFAFSCSVAQAQVQLAFQGAENSADDTWNYTSTGAGPEAVIEAQSPPNIKAGNFSLVVGGTDPSAGSCFGGGAGSGAAIDNIFTFESIDLSAYPEVEKTLEFWYGSRRPYCNGSGWDTGENLLFTPILDGVAGTSILLETGGGDLSLSIQETSFQYDIPPCAESFGFVLQINLNRRDELLFLDDVSLTVAGGNPPVVIDAGQGGQVCPGNEISLTGFIEGGLSNASWTGGAGSFSNPASLETVYTAGENESGSVVLVLSALTSCGFSVESETTISVAGSAPVASIISDIGNAICPGQTGLLTAFGGTEYLWSNGETAEDIFITEPGTYSVEVSNECGTDTAELVIVPGDVVDVELSLTLCENGEVTLPGGSTVNEAGVYEVLVEVPESCDTLFTATVTPAIPLSATFVDTACNYDEETFVLTFHIEGGDPLTLIANGIEGSFQGNLFTSLPLPAETAYSVTVTDGNGCDTVVVSGFEACICPAQAQLGSSHAICFGDEALLTVSFQGIPPFTFGYSDGTNQFTGFSQSTSIEIPVMPAETTVYTAVGISDSLCQGTAEGSAEITVLPLPDAGDDSQATLCDNAPETLLFDLLDGTPQPGGVWVFQFGDTLAGQSILPSQGDQGLYIYTVDGGICGTDASFLNLFFSQSPEAQIMGAYGRCPDQEVFIPLHYGGNLPASLTYHIDGMLQPALQIDQANPSLPAGHSGTYTLIAINDGTCIGTVSGSALVETLPLPEVQFTRSYLGEAGGSDVFGFFAEDSLPGLAYSWSFFEILEDGTQVRFAQAEGSAVQLELRGRNGGTFRACLSIISQDGCSTEVCEIFEVIAEQHFYMPNAFTPDGDGVNDLFYPIMRGYDNHLYSFRIYDRSGALVFATNDPDEKWNGSINGGTHYAAAGMYLWRVEMFPRHKAGSEVKQGHVTLLR